ncbi:WYL domain-containing protein [Corynebacterium matruchotii]|jgi:hypothetical protein|uniref:helix-turn-helix transcriptional regulator n=1 Tax=Corynebacterium matruchotii TaxID=43768 RepID=UPI0028EBFE01|nr:WYL domain-containing protein [Corynebacterium matruchotii]
MARPKNQSTTDIVRMLNLLPYFQQHPGRSTMEAAVDLGLDPTTIMDDLNRLFCCGIGDMPDELVDLDPQRQAVQIYDAQGMDKPLRLTRTEAGALLLALESLESIPGLVEKHAVRSAATKLRTIMHNETRGVFDSEAITDTPDEPHTITTLRTALEQGHQITLDYYHRNRDDTTHRTLSPTRIFSTDGQTYLHAYDHHINDHRIFRTDMIHNITITTTPAEPHTTTLHFDTNDPFSLTHATEKATITINPNANWLVDTIPCDIETINPDGTITATLPLVSQEWLTQFALSHTDHITVTEPATIAHTIRQRAKVGLAAYHQSQTKNQNERTTTCPEYGNGSSSPSSSSSSSEPTNSPTPPAH